MSLCARMLARLSAAMGRRGCPRVPRWTQPLAANHDVSSRPPHAQPTKHQRVLTFDRTPVPRLAAVARGPTKWPVPSETIDGAAHAKGTTIQNVQVHHRRADVGVAQQLLHGPNVVAILEQLCRERMPECVWTHTFGDAGVSCRVGHRLLDNGFVEVKARRWSPIADRCRCDRQETRNANPTPWPHSGTCGRARRVTRRDHTLAPGQPDAAVGRPRDDERSAR